MTKRINVRRLRLLFSKDERAAHEAEAASAPDENQDDDIVRRDTLAAMRPSFTEMYKDQGLRHWAE
jgi:hypothetical protein